MSHAVNIGLVVFLSVCVVFGVFKKSVILLLLKGTFWYILAWCFSHKLYVAMTLWVVLTFHLSPLL